MADNRNDFVIEDGILKKYNGSNAFVTVPNGVTRIGFEAFKWNKELTSVILPSQLTIIENASFLCCDHLCSIVFPESLTSIGEEAFAWCERLSKIRLPISLTSIGKQAFYCCGSITDITLPESIGEIGNEAFNGCERLKTVSFPKGLKSVGDRAWKDCPKLERITATAEQMDQIWSQLHPEAKLRVALNCMRCNSISPKIKQYIQKNRDKIVSEIIELDDPSLMEQMLGMIKAPDPDTVETFIKTAEGKVNLTAFLLDYKASHFSAEEVERLHDEQKRIGKSCFQSLAPTAVFGSPAINKMTRPLRSPIRSTVFRSQRSAKEHLKATPFCVKSCFRLGLQRS